MKYTFKFIKCMIYGIWFFKANLIKYSIKYIPKIRNELNKKIGEAVKILIDFDFDFISWIIFKRNKMNILIKRI